MKYIFLLPLLFLSFISGFSQADVEVAQEDEYSQFKIVPDYIANPTPERKIYFDAYNKTLEDWGVPFEELYVPTSKGIAHVITSGPKNGTPIILLHGMCGSSTMWYSHSRELSQEYRLFAIDLIIEPGKSYKTENINKIDHINLWYDEIFSALNLNSFYVMGPSRGGWLATNLALNSTKDIKGLVLLSPVQTLIWIPISWKLLKNTFNIFYSTERGISRTMETLTNDTSKINPDYLEQYRQGRKNDSVNKFIPQMVPFGGRKLRSLKMPVLVLVGDNDMLNNKHSIKRAKRLFPDFHGGIVANSGHFLSVDQEDEINRRILEFLKYAEAKHED
ncbi:alpha/beta hydrolase [Aequorivita sp. SDUM287046]|uniref:Alpha/beta hydrolase n=1 Tax=Aequorivita aurantiaca TaxID=3053356 RepID=A0ABT8DFW9_9FLAO|nr:alpha/beta hydrolase [Aequorivita aurantiaca]MDN3724261.1 alpha/beta hydrolase [Aequorivita aurantiaca]